MNLDCGTIGGVCNSLNAMESLYRGEKTSLCAHLNTAQKLIWQLWDAYLKEKGFPSDHQIREFAELKNMSPDEYMEGLLKGTER